VEEKDRNTAKRSAFSIIIAAVSMCVAGFALLIVQKGASSSVDLRIILTQKPGGPMMLAGLLLVVVSGITLVFRSQIVSRFASLARWLGDFFLGNTQQSGARLPDEGVERNLAPKFNDKMVIVMAAMDLCVGLCLIGAGFALNMAP
jgi:hypothetical protein